MTDNNDENKPSDSLEDQLAENNNSDATGDINVEDFEHQEANVTKFAQYKELFLEKFHNYKIQIKDKFDAILARKKSFEIKSPEEEIIRANGIKITYIDKLKFYLKQLELEKIVARIFDPNSRTQINQITLITFLVIASYQTGKLLASLLKGKDSAKINKVATVQLSSNSLNALEIEQLKNSNIFQTESANMSTSPVMADGKKYTPEKCDKADRPTSLPLKLINTVVLQDSIKSVASVQVRGKIESFRAGDSIPDMAKIDKITRLELIIKNLKSGECESIQSSNPDPASKISVMSPSQSRQYKSQAASSKGIVSDGNKFKIKKSLLEDQLKDLSALLTQARAIKIENPDGTLSFKLVEIEPGSIFSTLGVQNEDIITHINGNPIRNMNEIMSLFSKIRNMSNLELQVNRAGSANNLSYSFE